MNNPIYLGLSMSDLSKTVMYEFWYDYVKPKYGEKVKLCYMDTDSFTVHAKIDDIYKDISQMIFIKIMLKQDLTVQIMS